MAHYAKVVQGIVKKVIVAEQDFIDNMVDNEPGKWIQTSYNTSGGVHYNDDGTPSDDQSKALRKNFAGVGGYYDVVADAFYAQKPYASWTLNTDTYYWECPVAYPEGGGSYNWNEDEQTWDAAETE